MQDESVRMPDRERFGDHRTFFAEIRQANPDEHRRFLDRRVHPECHRHPESPCGGSAPSSSTRLAIRGLLTPTSSQDSQATHGPIGLPPVKLPNGSPMHRSPEQIEAEENARKAREAEKALAERRELEAKAQRLKVAYDSEWTLEKLRIAVQDAENELREAKEKAEEEERKKPLLKRADDIKLIVDKTLPYKELKQLVEKGEHKFAAHGRNQAKIRQYEENLKVREYLLARGPNARCPHPKCHYQWRTERKNGQFICPKMPGAVQHHAGQGKHAATSHGAIPETGGC